MSPTRPGEPHRELHLSRRRLLAASTLAVAAGTLGTGWRTSPAAACAAEDPAYQREFSNALAADPQIRRYSLEGGEFLYRPRQLLCADEDTQRVLHWLEARDLRAYADKRFAGVTKLRFLEEVDVPAVVTTLRDPEQWPGEPVPQVQPHHATVGYGNIMGNPGAPPQVAAALPPPDPKRVGEGAGVTVGICDTGIWANAGAYHPQWLNGTYLPEADDEDPLYAYDNVLAMQGGHGTFVAGVVRQAAPGVSFDPEPALNATGVGDEEMLVAALDQLNPECSIINLSLGCFTMNDLPPLPMVNTLGKLDGSTVAVAAAGNAGVNRPTWPAALQNVVAVAAVCQDGKLVEPAPYSNFGDWVDACAAGDRVSTYVKGRFVLPGLPDQFFDGFASWAGTSFATGHVSGRLARIMTDHGVDAGTARSILLSPPRWHPDYGVLVG